MHSDFHVINTDGLYTWQKYAVFLYQDYITNGQLGVKGPADAEFQDQMSGIKHWIRHMPVCDLYGLDVNIATTHSDLE